MIKFNPTKVAEDRKNLAAKLALLDKIEGTYKKVEDLVKKEGFADLNSFLAELNPDSDSTPTEKRTRTPITPELIASLKADTEAGMSGAKIVEKYGIAQMTYKKYKDLNFFYTAPKPKGRKKA